MGKCCCLHVAGCLTVAGDCGRSARSGCRHLISHADLPMFCAKERAGSCDLDKPACCMHVSELTAVCGSSCAVVSWVGANVFDNSRRISVGCSRVSERTVWIPTEIPYTSIANAVAVAVCCREADNPMFGHMCESRAVCHLKAITFCFQAAGLGGPSMRA